jgi:putative ABC transport system permease protein
MKWACVSRSAATPQAIVRLVITESGRLVLVGIVLGRGGAFGVTRYVSTLLYGVSASDAATFLVTASGLAAATMLASYVPARRAAKVDPLVTLRQEQLIGTFAN